MQKVFIVEANFLDPKQEIWEDWLVCDFADITYCSTNFYTAHKLKREIQKYLQTHGSKNWYKNCFRVRAYEPVNKFEEIK